MGKIILEGMDFFAYHGCYHEERVTGTRFLVDLTLEADISVAEQSDSLEDTFNYTEVYNAVKNQMEKKSHLIENVAHRIIFDLSERFPQVQSIEVRVSKLNPPVLGKVRQVGYQMSWNK